MTFRAILRYEPPVKKFRLFRYVWQDGDESGKVTFALQPKLFAWEREFQSWRLSFLGLVIHRETSRGGRYA